jgi:hypothetical protein
MKTKLGFFFGLSLFFSTAFGQNNAFNNWSIGNGAGLSFNNGTVTQYQSSISCQDISSTVSNGNGQLLFYCNGTTVWDKNHNVMVNGTGLLGDVTGGHTALIVPQPESKLYYIFTIDKYADSDGLRYHIVDMGVTSGLGEVGSKNNLLFSPSAEKIAAVWNDAQGEFKIVTHQFGNNTFSVYTLDDQGLNPTPVNSSVGSSHVSGVYGQSHNALGQMSISPDGTKIGLALAFSGKFEFFDFDINTGLISNPISIQGYSNAWGVEFSPDSKLVYFTRWTENMVYQANITNWNSTAVDSSTYIVGTVPSTGLYSVGYLERTPDNRIFIAHYGSNDLAVISNPNNSGPSCNFAAAGLTLQFGSSFAGLSDAPAYPTSSKLSITSQPLHENMFSVYPNPGNGKVFLTVNKDINVISIDIFDIGGKKHEADIFRKDHDYEINNLTERGVYFINVTSSDGQTISKKLIVE